MLYVSTLDSSQNYSKLYQFGTVYVNKTKQKKCNLTLAMSPHCHSNSPLSMLLINNIMLMYMKDNPASGFGLDLFIFVLPALYS